MNRRRVLATIGAGTLSLAGCLAGETTDPTDTAGSTPPASPSGTPPMDTGGRSKFDPATTSKQVDVGTRAGVNEDFRPHYLQIWNAATSQRVVNVRILDRVAGESVHRMNYSIGADDALRITLAEPSRYFVQLWGPTIATETLLVPCSLFDCNSSTTNISIYDDGQIGSVVSATMMACPAPDC